MPNQLATSVRGCQYRRSRALMFTESLMMLGSTAVGHSAMQLVKDQYHAVLLIKAAADIGSLRYVAFLLRATVSDGLQLKSVSRGRSHIFSARFVASTQRRPAKGGPRIASSKVLTS